MSRSHRSIIAKMRHFTNCHGNRQVYEQNCTIQIVYIVYLCENIHAVCHGSLYKILRAYLHDEATPINTNIYNGRPYCQGKKFCRFQQSPLYINLQPSICEESIKKNDISKIKIFLITVSIAIFATFIVINQMY